MTVMLLERYVKSEVDNLHIRIDQLTDYVERIDQRLSVVERQLSLLINSVEDLKVRVAYIEDNMVTKADLQTFGQNLKQEILSEVRAMFDQLMTHIIARDLK